MDATTTEPVTPPPCKSIFRAILYDYWRDKRTNKILIKAFKRKDTEDGLSVFRGVVETCADADSAASKFDKPVYGFVRFDERAIYEIAAKLEVDLRLICDKVHHAEICTFPIASMDDPEVRLQMLDIASELFERLSDCDQPLPAPLLP